jgi:hypothetical protein
MERIDIWMKTMMQAYSFPVNISLVAFRKKDVDRLHRESVITCNTLQALREAGKSKMISTFSCSLHNEQGKELILKDTKEINYPAEYCAETSNTNQASSCALSITPICFTMREEGTVFQFIAEPSDLASHLLLFSFTCRFIHVALAEWKTYDAVTLLKSGKAIRTPCKQPIFYQMSDEGQCMIMPGETLLLGGGRTFDQEWVYYAFLTLDIVPAKKIVLE